MCDDVDESAWLTFQDYVSKNSGDGTAFFAGLHVTSTPDLTTGFFNGFARLFRVAAATCLRPTVLAASDSHIWPRNSAEAFSLWSGSAVRFSCEAFSGPLPMSNPSSWITLTRTRPSCHSLTFLGEILTEVGLAFLSLRAVPGPQDSLEPGTLQTPDRDSGDEDENLAATAETMKQGLKTQTPLQRAALALEKHFHPRGAEWTVTFGSRCGRSSKRLRSSCRCSSSQCASDSGNALETITSGFNNKTGSCAQTRVTCGESDIRRKWKVVECRLEWDPGNSYKL